jgi:hypothetical protein
MSTHDPPPVNTPRQRSNASEFIKWTIIIFGAGIAALLMIAGCAIGVAVIATLGSSNTDTSEPQLTFNDTHHYDDGTSIRVDTAANTTITADDYPWLEEPEEYLVLTVVFTNNSDTDTEVGTAQQSLYIDGETARTAAADLFDRYPPELVTSGNSGQWEYAVHPADDPDAELVYTVDLVGRDAVHFVGVAE